MVHGLNLCTMLVLELISEFYSAKYLFIVGYNYFSSLCHKDVNQCAQIRKIHRDESDFICINSE